MLNSDSHLRRSLGFNGIVVAQGKVKGATVPVDITSIGFLGNWHGNKRLCASEVKPWAQEISANC